MGINENPLFLMVFHEKTLPNRWLARPQIGALAALDVLLHAPDDVHDDGGWFACIWHHFGVSSHRNSHILGEMHGIRRNTPHTGAKSY